MTHPLPQRIPVPLGVVFGLTVALSCRQAPKAVSVAALTQDAQAPVAVTYNPRTGRPSFIRGRIPPTVMGLQPGDTSRAVPYGFMQRYHTLFGVDSTAQDLRFVETRVDTLGMRHTIMQQVYQGVEVYAATVTVHQAPSDGAIAAATSNVVPGVRVATT
ncbi:MAG: hypothetical protein ACREJ4_02660, partial [Candidatus Methylomirabilaceae bacterium]